MKKILRNASLFIIAIVLTFGFGLEVKADGCEGLDYNRCRLGERGVIKPSGSATAVKYQQLTASTSNTRTNLGKTKFSEIGVKATFGGSDASSANFNSYQDSYSAFFCLDAQYEGAPKVYAERFLFDSNTANNTKVFDAAVMSVMTDGGVMRTASNKSDYWSRLMAIRALAYTFHLYSSSNPDHKNILNAGYSVANEWNKKASSELNALNAELTKLTGGRAVGNVSAVSGYGFSGGPVDTGYGYYVRALQAATSYAKTLAGQTNIDTKDIEAGEIVKEGEGTDTVKVSKDVKHIIKLTNFSKNNKFIINSNGNNGIKFAEGTQYDGLTAYISAAQIHIGTSFRNLSTDEIANGFDKDWVELGYINTGEGVEDVRVELTVHFEGFEKSSDPRQAILKCGQQPIKYSIDGTFDNSIMGSNSEYVATIWYAGQKEMQRYVGIEQMQKRDDAGTPWESPYETYLIDSCSCESLKEACMASGRPNSDECIELKESNCGCEYLEAMCAFGDNEACEKFETECDLKCDTYVDTFECCDSSDQLIVSTLDDHEVSILGPGKDNPEAPNVKACFVTSVDKQAELNGDGTYKNNSNIAGVKDQKGNTYTLADMKENKYCTVSCKEDYIMTMPTAKLVNAGRYFTFKAKIEGNKVCYTNTIDRETYNKDIIEKQEDMINKYNTYRKWYYLYHGEINPVDGSYTGHSCHCDGHGCGPSCDSTDYYPQWRATGTVPDWTEVTSKPLETGVVTISQHEQPVSDTNTYQQPTGATSYSCPGGSWSCHCDEDGCDTCSCSGGSTTYYTGHQTVCDEGCYRAILRGRMETARAQLIAAQEAYKAVLKEYDECSEWSSEINYDPEVYYDYSEDYMEMLANGRGDMVKEVSGSSANEWYCNSRVSSGSGNESKGELSDQNYERCNNTSTGKNKTSLNYIYCDPNGTCRITPERVSDARYKKVTSSVTGNYKPETLFYNAYPTGEITTSKSDNNVALENKLPVALNTKRGIYKYTVNIENLGEFYDQAPTDNIGRYVGDRNAIVDPTTLVYNCSYLVNITKTTGWVCDFDDTCEDDCISNCVGPNCDNYCDGNDCVADCIGLGCIYDSGAGSSLLEKIVSLNKLFPNGTDSYNWDESRNDKARMTVSEIEGKGNAVYNEQPILSLTITPSTARQIKEYNNDVINDGGYSNMTVSCSNYNGYEQMACYSSFISDVLSGEYGSIVNDNSLIADTNYRYGDRYFTLWPNGVSEDDMIGPAWK